MPFPLIFEELLPHFGLRGECTLWESTPEFPTNIIQTTEPWGVIFDWTTIGPLNNIMCGTWRLQCFLEMMGKEEAPTLPDKIVPFVSGPHTYKSVFTFQPPMLEGVYKLVTLITMKGPLGVPGPIAGMGVGPMITFYEGGPIT